MKLGKHYRVYLLRCCNCHLRNLRPTYSNTIKWKNSNQQSGKKIDAFDSTHLCILCANIDRRHVIDDVLDGPSIDSLPIATWHVATQGWTSDWRWCGRSRGWLRFRRYASRSPRFRPLPFSRCESTWTRQIQRTRHSRVSFVRTYHHGQFKFIECI